MRPRGIASAATPLPLGWIALALAVLVTLVAPPRASAELGQLRISRGFGVHYLPLYVMENGGIMAFTTQQFRGANPKLATSFVAVLQEAIEFIAANKAEAAQIYVETGKVKQPEAEIVRIINDPALRFTLIPTGIMSYANFMHRVGLLKLKPESWKDVFVSEVHGLPHN